MQADPRLGMLQGLVVGLPSTSAFARHISVRHAAWHALLHHRQRLVAGRLRAILGPQRGVAARAVHRALRLPALARRQRSDRHILSHDQIEAVLMRRAGYEVRVLPQEELALGGESADLDRVHPPRPALVPGQHAVLAVSVRCPGLRPVSRYQLASGDADVHRLAGLDRAAGARHRSPSRCAGAAEAFIHADAGMRVCSPSCW